MLTVSLLWSLISIGLPRPVYAAEGNLDPSFDSDGMVVTSFPDSAGAFDLAIQSDGKTVAVGFARISGFEPQQFAVVRYNINGSLDSTFGNGGKALIDFGCTASATATIIIQPDGKILVGGTTCLGTGNSDFALARLNSNGSLDGTFGVTGLVTTDLGGQDELNDLALQPDGKIIGAGEMKTGAPLSSSFAVVRYDASGTPDPTFNGTGKVITSFGAGTAAAANGVLVQPDTNILVAGTATTVAGSNIAMARYDTNGLPDPAFSGGTAVANFPSLGNEVALHQGTTIVVAGKVDGFYGIARFNSDGSIDGSFGTGGRSNIGIDGEANDLAIQIDSKIVTAGFVSGMSGSDFAVARFNNSGPDSSFGTNGFTSTSFTNQTDKAFGVGIQANGRIVAAGFVGASGQTAASFGVARYLALPPFPMGTDTIGLYDPSVSQFYLRNTNSAGPADLTFVFGSAGNGWTPITGDWDGDGTDTIGLFNPVGSVFHLRNSNSVGVADIVFTFGPAGQNFIPITGDWDGDGVDTIGLYSPSNSVFFLKNTNSVGFADIAFTFGPAGAGWIPVAGDWNGDGIDTIGLYDPLHSAFFLRNSNNVGFADLAFAYGSPGQGFRPLAGDWNNDVVDTVGLYHPGTGRFFLRNSNTIGVADITFVMTPTNPGWIPIAGDWNSQ